MVDALPPYIWLPPKPAIIRPATQDLLRYGSDPYVASFMPGITGPVSGGGGGAAASLSTLTYTGLSAEALSGASITIPASAAVDDIAILADIMAGTPTLTPSKPASFTALASGTGAGDSIAIYASYRKLTAGNPGSSVTGMNDASERKLMLIFRPNVATASITPSVWNQEATTGNPAAQAANASGQTPIVLVIGISMVISGTAAFSTASPAFDGTVATSDADILMGYKIYNVGDTPANHSIDQDDLGGSQGLISGYITLT